MRIVNKKSFTLMEIIVVVIIVGVLAGLALPRFSIVVEKVRSSEGVQILTTLLTAQKRYAMENGGSYQNGSGLSNMLADGDLDVNIPQPANFNVPYIYNNPAQVALIQRQIAPITFTYGLSIDANGNITCTDYAGYTYCSKIRSW